MKTFLQFFKESEESGTHTLFHPIRGMYKVRKDGEFHHVYNDENEITHTFVGKTEDEVIHILKHEHDLIYAGKLHEEFIMELKKPVNKLPPSESKALNTSRGAYNEALVAYHLNGKKWINDEHKKYAMHHKLKLQIVDSKYGTNEVKAQEDRAPEQTKSFLEHAKQLGYEGIQEIHHTSKPGEIEQKTGIKATQQENPSDVVVKFKKKPQKAKHGYLGLSLKSSKSKAIGFHNGGIEEFGNLIGHDLIGHVKTSQENFMKVNKMASKSRTAAAKEIAGEKQISINGKSVENPLYRKSALYEKGLEHARKLNKQVRDKLHEGYSMMKHEELKQHLLKTFIKGDSENALPYVKTHGTGGGDSRKPASAHTTDPSDNDTYHQIKNAKKIHLEKSGDAGITVHTEDKDGNKKKAFNIQVKHGNGPLTNLAILGQP